MCFFEALHWGLEALANLHGLVFTLTPVITFRFEDL